jgi:hypothetical protein
VHAVGKDAKKEDRRGDDSQNEESDEDHPEPRCIGHPAHPSAFRQAAKLAYGATSESLLDDRPRLDPGNAIFNALDHNFGTGREPDVIEAVGAEKVRDTAFLI